MFEKIKEKSFFQKIQKFSYKKEYSKIKDLCKKNDGQYRYVGRIYRLCRNIMNSIDKVSKIKLAIERKGPYSYENECLLSETNYRIQRNDNILLQIIKKVI